MPGGDGPFLIGENMTGGYGKSGPDILHGCTIEDGALIGMGATVLNGAVIGAGSLVGAGALVTEGKVIPSGSLVVGAPARVVRDIDEAARARLLWSAQHYRDNAARFRQGMRAVAR